jgi:hypothetical protein
MAALLRPCVSAGAHTTVDAVPLMLMIRPVPSAGISGRNACVTRKKPISLPSRSPIQSVSGQRICRSVRRIGLPALLTTMCTVPKAPWAASATAFTESVLVMSPDTGTALTP